MLIPNAARASEPGPGFRVEALMYRLAIGCALFLLTVGGGSGARAAEIHKWVDEHGVTHYSDTAPASPEISVTRLDIDSGDVSRGAPAAAPDHYYSIANQWQRMNEERLRRLQLELQRASIAAERRATAPPVVDHAADDGNRYLVAYPYPYHRPYRPRRHGPRSQLRHQPGAGSLGAFPTQ